MKGGIIVKDCNNDQSIDGSNIKLSKKEFKKVYYRKNSTLKAVNVLASICFVIALYFIVLPFIINIVTPKHVSSYHRVENSEENIAAYVTIDKKGRTLREAVTNTFEFYNDFEYMGAVIFVLIGSISVLAFCDIKVNTEYNNQSKKQ